MTNTKIDWPWPPGTRVQRIKENHNNCIVGEIYTVVEHIKTADSYWDDVTILEVPNYKFAARNFERVYTELNFPKNLTPEYKELFT